MSGRFTEHSELTSLFDSHAHLDYVSSEKIDEVMERAHQNGVGYILTVGDGEKSIRRSLEIARSHDNVFVAGGIHPHESRKAQAKDLLELEKLLDVPVMIAVGETGLDFHYDNSPRKEQERVFAAQIGIALKLRKPLIVHTREAWERTREILKSEGGLGLTLIFHCFSGSYKEALEMLEYDTYFSAAGPLTYPKAEELRQVFARLPEERILIETDCPYLAPVPYRGETNEPSYLHQTALKMAEIRGVKLPDLVPVLLANTFRAFSLGMPRQA